MNNFIYFQHELEILKQTNKELQDLCVINQINDQDIIPKDNQKVIEYKLKNTEDTECTYIGLKEPKFLDILRDIQTKRAEKASGFKFERKPIIKCERGFKFSKGFNLKYVAKCDNTVEYIKT